MKTKWIFIAVPVMFVMLLCWAGPVKADRGGRGGRGGAHVTKGYVLDNRYHHNRHYPRLGYQVNVLPGGARLVHYRRDRYYFHGGSWYRPVGRGYTVVRPPIGLIVPFLPPFYTTIWAGGYPYYYADGVYYGWRADERVYVVSEPPLEQEVVEQSALPSELFIYPKEGQSKEQQATDRYECHRWAADQTGFDPTQPSGNVSAELHISKQVDYQRAIKACLEARNYSVQ